MLEAEEMQRSFRDAFLGLSRYEAPSMIKGFHSKLDCLHVSVVHSCEYAGTTRRGEEPEYRRRAQKSSAVTLPSASVV